MKPIFERLEETYEDPLEQYETTKKFLRKNSLFRQYALFMCKITGNSRAHRSLKYWKRLDKKEIIYLVTRQRELYKEMA
jgi:hypothetical protein